jgi:hypothetical protein
MAHDKPAERDQLSAEIAALEAQTTLQLRERWKALYGTEPPPRASRDLMKRGRVPYSGTPAWQPQRLHAPPAGASCQDAVARRPAKRAPMRKLHAGAMLLREWGGIQYNSATDDRNPRLGGRFRRAFESPLRRSSVFAPRAVRL